MNCSQVLGGTEELVAEGEELKEEEMRPEYKNLLYMLNAVVSEDSGSDFNSDDENVIHAIPV